MKGYLMQTQLKDAETVMKITKAVMAPLVQPEDIDFLDKAMRTYAAHVVHEFLEQKQIAA